MNLTTVRHIKCTLVNNATLYLNVIFIIFPISLTNFKGVQAALTGGNERAEILSVEKGERGRARDQRRPYGCADHPRDKGGEDFREW